MTVDIALIRIWHPSRKEFISDGMLTTDNRFMGVDAAKNIVLEPIVEVDFFTGRVANDGKPVYQNDLVRAESQNEFGSWRTYEAGVIYDPSNMAYVLDEKMKDGEELLEESVATTKIIAVLGHLHI